MNQQIKAYIFDFDGTLADTEGFHFDVYKRLLKARYGVDLDWPHWLNYIGRTDPDFHRMMEKDYGIVIDSDSVMAEYFAILLAEEPSAVRPYLWLRGLLEDAKAKGILCGVLSSGNRDVICACLKEWELHIFFDDADIISVSAGIFTKQDVFADPARYIPGFAGISAEIALFEDSIHTIEKARACRIGFVTGVTHEYNRGIEAWCDALREG
ncbi:MAG: HAD family phosphatase [Firmicutes bacterium]|nr:HAD family phosphatase [Bacillota bacterium]